MNRADESFKEFILDQLGDLDRVEARRMFGGFGIYRDEIIFGILHRGRLYFKVDKTSVKEYRRRGTKPFRPNGKQTLKTYYQVPPEIIEDADELQSWADRAVRCQQQQIQIRRNAR